MVTKQDRISSMNFDYDTTDELEREEHKIPFQAPVSVPVLENSSYTLDNFEYYRSFLTLIIDSLRNLNSFVMLNDIAQAEEASQCPLILAVESFYYTYCRCGIQSDSNIDITNPNSYTKLSGYTPENYPFVSLHTWDEKGLFDRFWKNYDSIIRHSFNTLVYRAMLPAQLLQNFRFDRLKLIDGQPLIPLSLKYTLTADPLIDTEITLKTVKVYE